MLDQDEIAADPAQADAMDSDEEFVYMDKQIREQVVVEIYKRQVNNGEKLSKICAQVGRCAICTLVPPCKHRKQID